MVLFPSRGSGEGQCALGLTHVMAEAHNGLIRTMCEDAGGLPTPAAVAPTPELSAERQLVVFDERKLHLLLLANSEYEVSEVGSGEGTQWRLKEKAFEAQVVER